MRNSKLFIAIGGILLIVVVFFAWIRLPLTQGQIWMSPDETANAQTAAQFSETGHFFIPTSLSGDFLWAHPRSFVFLPALERIVPIGFLGMPIILSIIYKLIGLLGILFFTPLLALVTLYPLYKSFPNKWSEYVKFFVLLIWMTFPTIIIYSNRGAFAQLPIVCLMIWIWWLLTSKHKLFKYIIAGLFLGLIAIIRPPEIIWALPIAVTAFLYQSEAKNTKHILSIILPFVFVIIFGALAGYQTYGQWFVSGYQMRPSVNIEQNIISANVESNTASVIDILPFSFHPRNILWNLKNYLVYLFWPWFIISIFGLYILYKHKVWKTKSLWLLLSLFWMMIVLVGFYGNGIYQDHVIVNQISMGNSFLRYVLPLSIVFAICIGLVLDFLWKHWMLKIFAICITMVLVFTGIWQAYAKDDEGILENQNQLYRYNQIRKQTAQFTTPDTYILSDRSDKIFFPYFNAVSPLPDSKQIYSFIKSGNKIQLYLTTQDDVGMIKWLDAGLRLTPLFSNDNQTLYDVSWIDYNL
ncbi:glycosyltransferase family 39 protein [Patescibacteria group bacterium]|nr:glycosyltransferase family 39 protein [Patescibacteria group bacterium]